MSALRKLFFNSFIIKIQKFFGSKILQKRIFTSALGMVVCIPSGITSVDMGAIKENCKRVNRTKIYLIHKPMAAAIEIGVDIYNAFRNKYQKSELDKNL